MRIYLNSMDHPKRLSKRLSKELKNPLHLCQKAVSQMLGYQDWHELEKVTQSHNRQPSRPDQLCSNAVVRSRRFFQANQLAETLELRFDKAEALVESLSPTGSMPYAETAGTPLVDELFPLKWQCGPLELQDISREPSNLLFEIGNAEEQLKISNILQRMSSGEESLERLKGTRVLTATLTTALPDVPAGKPFISLLMHLVPIVEEDVVVRLEINLLVGACSLYVPDEALEAAVDMTLDYLGQPGLNTFSGLPVSGSIEGIEILLTGKIRSAGLHRFYATLLESLNQHEDIYQGNETGLDEPDEFDVLPIASVEDLVEVQLTEEERKAATVAAMNDFVQWEQKLMQAAPRLLSDYLERQNRKALASKFREHEVGTLQGQLAFLAEVRKAELSYGLESEIAFYVHHHFVSRQAAIYRDKQDKAVSGDMDAETAWQRIRDKMARASRDLGAGHMADFYANAEGEMTYQMATAGMHLLFSVVLPGDEELDEDEEE